jgi:F1F0 ATPase subunit 2
MRRRKKMSEMVVLSVPLLAGVLIGAFFFGGLWWTVRKGLTSKHPALWFFGSTLLRTSFAVAGFYFVSGGDWRRVLACLFGFFIARVLVTRLTRTAPEGIHAP